jgi:putative transposase
MPNYRRYTTGAKSYFFTLATYQRQPILLASEFRTALRDALIETRRRFPFSIDSWVLLPDHLHSIWTLPDENADFSQRWSMIKRLTTQQLQTTQMVRTAHPTESRSKRREGTLWQRRFWEHQIRDEKDLRHHLDYCYWNPVRHGLVDAVRLWPYSTFHRDVRKGFYPENWGNQTVQRIDIEYGE